MANYKVINDDFDMGYKGKTMGLHESWKLSLGQGKGEARMFSGGNDI